MAGKKIVKDVGGRPTSFNDATAKRLLEIFKIGGTIKEACASAKVAERTYHYWYSTNQVFADSVDAARNYATVSAKNVVVKKIERGDDTNARWWLERKARDEFGNQNVTQDNRIQQLVVSNNDQLTERLVTFLQGFNQRSDIQKG